MEVIKIEYFIKKENPTLGTRFVQDILTDKQRAKDVGGLFVVMPAGGEVPYHFHDKRESIMIIISGEATAIVEGKELAIEANDILHIPAREKHKIVNRTDKDLRYIEFFTFPPVTADFIEVK